MQSWTLTGHRPCNNYCCNPDGDPGGDWCVVVDATCQGTTWGYCAASAASGTATSLFSIAHITESGRYELGKIYSQQDEQALSDSTAITDSHAQYGVLVSGGASEAAAARAATST